MVTHFICLTLGCLQDDKVTVSHWVTAERTESIITLAVGLSTACAGKQAPAIRGAILLCLNASAGPGKSQHLSSLLPCWVCRLLVPTPGFVQNPLTQTEGEAATVGVPPGGVLVTDHVNLEDPHLFHEGNVCRDTFWPSSA